MFHIQPTRPAISTNYFGKLPKASNFKKAPRHIKALGAAAAYSVDKILIAGQSTALRIVEPMKGFLRSNS